MQDWLDLRGEQKLLLEIDEDHSIVSDETTENTQVKLSESSRGVVPLSLRSHDVSQAILRYWEGSEQGTDARIYLRFLTNRGAAREKGSKLPNGSSGIDYWSSVIRDGNLGPLRELLIEIFTGTALATWLETEPSDGEVRSRLLQRVQFVLKAPGDAALQAYIRDQLGLLYLHKGHYETTADTAFPLLLDRVFAAASAPNAQDRRLTLVDLHRTLEEAIPRLGALALAPVIRSSPESGYAVAPTMLLGHLSKRASTVQKLIQRIDGASGIWLHGANGVGKSTLAALLSHEYGGTWLTADFRPFQAGENARGAIGVWHELVSTTLSENRFDGIILDDISAQSIELLKPRIAGLLAACRNRDARIIITSNHTPSSALLATVNVPATAAVEAPYFDLGEVRELVAQPTPPKAELIDAWAGLIHTSTSGGHPLLAIAKITNLQTRGWPSNALLEDIGGTANEGVNATRAEARRRLVAELPSNVPAREVLHRVSTVFQSFDDGLVRRLCHDAPAVQHFSDALALLKGAWIERAPSGDWRLSPLIADLSTDVPGPQAKQWRRIAAEYWLSQRPMNARTLPLCFWNAFLGHHFLVLIRVGQSILTLPRSQLESAASTLVPLVAFRTDTQILPEEPVTSCTLRLIQVVIADALEDETVANAAAKALVLELEHVPIPELRELEILIAAKTVLALDRVWISPAIQLGYLVRLKKVLANAQAGGFPQLQEALAPLIQGLPDGVDLLGALLAGLFVRANSSARLSGLIDELGNLNPDDRTPLLQSADRSIQGLGPFIQSAWANQQLKGNDLTPLLRDYQRMRSVVGGWELPTIEAEFAIAESVILDEGLEQPKAALIAINAAIDALGSLSTLLRQKSKVLARQGADQDAAAILLELEADLSALPPFDQALTLRDGAISAARIKRYQDALRMLRKANEVLSSLDGRQELQAGLLIEEALILWEDGAREDALQRLADAYDAIERFDPSSSKQAQRAHVMARAAGGLFSYDLGIIPGDSRPPLTIGRASQIELSEEPEAKVIAPLSDNWRILALLEADLGADIGIAARAAAKQSGTYLVTIEAIIANAHFAKAVKGKDIAAAVEAIPPAVSLMRLVKQLRGTGEQSDNQNLRADATGLKTVSVSNLIAEGWGEQLQGALADIMLMLAITDAWSQTTEKELEIAVRQHFASDNLLMPLLRAARIGSAVERPTTMPVLVASSIGALAGPLSIHPRERVLRDLYLIYQVANSLGRRALEPEVAIHLVNGWRYVLNHQRFLLVAPHQNVGAISDAIEAIEAKGLRAAAQLIRAGASASRVEMTEQWNYFLQMLERV